MLSSACHAPPSASLSSHLRKVLLSLSGRTAPQGCRHFSTAQQQSQEDYVQAERPCRISTREDRGYVYRHIHPQGRIIGRPGRRQLQSSEQLATDSLGRPSEVVVLRDVAGESETGSSVQTQVVSAVLLENAAEGAGLATNELQQAWSGGDMPAEQEEVHASMEQLRPHGSTVSADELKALRKQLVERYNMKQLVRYLVYTVGQKATAALGQEHVGDSDAIRVTAWRPGQTPLEKRLGRISFKKGELAKSKNDVAEQILRTGWQLITDKERQQVGEMELYLRPWQLTFLMDTKRDSRIFADVFIDSPLLARSSVVRPYREHHIVRVTARQADAEEIVLRLRKGLGEVRRGQMDLNVFSSMLRSHQSIADLFTPEDLKAVAHQTDSAITIGDDGMLNLYSVSDAKKKSSHARRLVLSLLELPSPTDAQSLDLASPRGEESIKTYTGLRNELRWVAHPVMDAPRRYTSTNWARLTAPAQTSSEVDENKQASVASVPVAGGRHWRRLMQLLATRLETVEPSQSAPQFKGTSTISTPWSDDPDPAWSVTMGSILRPMPSHSTANVLASHSQKAGASGPTPESATLFTKQVPGLVHLLTHFTALRDTPSTSQSRHGTDFGAASDTGNDRSSLLVHLTPVPFTQRGLEALKQLPRIVVEIELPGHVLRTSGAVTEPSLVRVSAMLHTQELNAAFPGHAADLSFQQTRNITLKAEALSACGNMAALVRQILLDLKAGTGYLPAMSNVTVNLPRSVVQPANKRLVELGGKDDFEAMYFVSHYEQVKSTDFVPHRDEKRLERMGLEGKLLAKYWPKSMVLRWRDIDAGAFGGRRTEISLTRCGESAAVTSVPAEVANAASIEVTTATSPADSEGRNPWGKDEESTARQLTRTAMSVLRLLTAGARGELRSPYEQSS